MKMMLTFLLSFFFNQCDDNINKNELDKNKQNKIIIIKTDELEENNEKIEILDLKENLYATIKSYNDSEPKCDRLKSSIKAYFPENYIIHFEGYLKKNKCVIKIGNSFYYIKKNNFVDCISIEEYILRFYCITDESNPLRKSPNQKSEILNYDLKKLSFNCIEIKGEWLKVRCNFECEGCGEYKNITGWIKWKENDKIILKQKLIC